MSSLSPSQSGQRLQLLLLVLGIFALRLHALTLQNIWWDEARNIDVALRPFAQIATAPELDIHPPVYFWLLHLWLGMLNFHTRVEPTLLAFGARLLSVAAAMIATVLLYPLGRRFGTPLAGLCAVAIAGFSPFWLAESQEARMYTVGFALLIAAAYFLLQIIEDWQAARPQRTASLHYLAFILCSALALLSHYNAIFILVAWYSWWGIVALMQPKRWAALRSVLLCGLAMSLLIAPILPIALRQIPGYANPNLGIPSLGDYLWQNWQAYVAGYAFDPAILNGNGINWLWAVLGLLLIGSLFHLAAARHAPRPVRYTPYTFLFAWLVGGLALYYIAVLDRGAFNVRYSSFITPALYLMLGLAVVAGGNLWRRLPVAGLVVLAVGIAPLLQADLYNTHFGREDIAGVTHWLRETTGPNDLILVDQKYPFGFYYHRYTIDAQATPTGPEAAPARYLFVDVNTLDQQLDAWAGQAERVFWVQWFESDTDPRHAVRFLLDKVGTRVDGRDFRGYSVDWWQLTPPTAFVLAPNMTPTTLRFGPLPGAAVETVAMSLPNKLAPSAINVPVVIRWQRVPTGQIDRPLKARVALYDAADNRLAQSDERLLNDRHLMPAEWDLVDQPLNVYLLELPPETGAGDYAVRLLVYDADTLEPLTVFDNAGNPAGIEVPLGNIRLTTAD